MKKFILLLIIALGATLTFESCSNDDSDPDTDDDEIIGTIIGNWEITAAVGEEWEYDNGVVNTNDPDEEFEGLEVVVTQNTVKIGSNGPFTYTYLGGVLTIDLNGDGTLVFDVKFESSSEMEWAEHEPDDLDDYEYNEEGDNYLFYQKTWTLEMQ